MWSWSFLLKKVCLLKRLFVFISLIVFARWLSFFLFVKNQEAESDLVYLIRTEKHQKVSCDVRNLNECNNLAMIRESQGRVLEAKNLYSLVCKYGEKAGCVNLAILNGDTTPLHHVVKTGDFKEIKKIVKHNWKSINIKDKHGKTALDYAVFKRNQTIINYLKTNGAK